MKKHFLLFLVFLSSCMMAWGQVDTLSYESIMSYYVSKTDTIEFYQQSGNADKVSELTKERDAYLDALGDNYGKGMFFFILSEYYYDVGDYQNALETGNKTEVIFKKVLGKEHPDYAMCLNDLAAFYSSLGDYTEAIRLGTEAMKIMKKVLGAEHPSHAKTLNNLANYYSDLGNYTEAIHLGTEATEIRKKVLGTEHPDYATSLNNLANYNAHLGNYTEAIRLGTEAMEIRKKAFGTNHPSYAGSLNNLADYNSSLGNYTEAIRLAKEAMEIWKKMLGTDHPNYALSLSNLASYYSSLGDYTEAIRLGTEATEIRKKVLGMEHPDYAISLSSLASYKSDLGNYSEAIRLETEAMEIKKKAFGTNHLSYAGSLNNLADYNSSLGNYTEAIRLAKEAMEIWKKMLGTDHPNYALSLSNLASYYSSLGDYTEAIRLGTEATEIRKKVLGMEHPDYAISLSSLASYKSDLGNYAEAIRLETEAMEIMKKILGTDHPDYALSLNNLAGYYFHLGNYTEAIRLGKEAIAITKKVFGTNHPKYSMSLNNLAIYHSGLGKYIEAAHLGLETVEITKMLLGKEHPSYAMSLHNLARYNYHLGNYPEAIQLGTEAMEIRKKVLGVEHPDYAASLISLAIFNAILSNYTEAIRLGTDAMEIRKKVLGVEHPDYTASLSIFSSIQYNQRNYSFAYNTFNQAIDIAQKYILSSFSELSSGLQESLWTKKHAYPFNAYLPSIVYRYKTNESVSELYDKTALFAKGILLNSSVGMRKLILESGDSALLSRYDALASNKSIYEKQLEKPIKERAINMDSLRSVIQGQEMELARDSKAYGDFARNLRINWKDVQQKLGSDDIAIEFLDFPLHGTDSTMYVALTLKKGYDCPHMTTLFEKQQLKSVPEESYYTNSDLYDLIWMPLEGELAGVKNIYFSPSGELHRIGIEYIPVTMTENICDKYSLHRLSSTRQLAFIQDETKSEKSVLYGGLKYDEAASTSVSSSAGKERGFIYIPRANVDSLDIRGSYQYLPGTKEETDNIVSDLSKRSIPYSYYFGKDGTEESFKDLDGTKPRMLHIATHGFYLTEQDAERKNMTRTQFLNDNNAYHEDKPMTRSGLLLSGCSRALNHESIPDDVEDGILTADEISKLDMRGLDLVVLSACLTGLGDITSGEGVFGLQRGFKNAGARTIIMSLWKVSDIATQHLMTSFYGHYLSGMSKEQSFRMAQDELRKLIEDRQDKPDWAAFVMLDGI